MNKQLLKTLLAAATLAATTSAATADEITATLEHTAGTSWGSAASNGNSVDSEKEYYNNDLASGWAGAAYIEFSFALPEGHTVAKATLNYSILQYNRSSYTEKIFYMNEGFVLDYDTIKNNSNIDLRFTNSRTELLTTEAHQGARDTGKEHIGLSEDVTSAVKTIAEAGQTYIIFQLTANNGSAHLYGKASANAPTLTIETASAEEVTGYTIKYVNGLGDSIMADNRYIGALIGTTVTASDKDREPIYIGDTQKYIYASGNRELTLTENANDNVITLVYREAELFEYTVISNLGDTIANGLDFENDTVSVGYPQYKLGSEGLLYESARATAGNYLTQFNLTENGQTVEIAYTATEIGEVVCLAEAENINGMTATSGGNANIRCSNALGAYNADTASAVVTTLEPGVYRMTAQVWGNAGSDILIDYGGDSPWTISLKGYLLTDTISVTITTPTDIAIPTCGTSTRCLDYLFIQKTGEYSAIRPTSAAIKADDDAFYNLQSIKTSRPGKGIYINKGRTVIVK